MTRRLAIPRRLSIRGKAWRVRWMTPSEKRGKHRADIGYCDPGRRLILLDRRQSRAELERTLVHEIVHAVLPEGFVNEERIACALEGPLRALILSGALSVTTEEV